MLGPLQTQAEYLQLTQALWNTIPLDFRRPYQTTFDLFQHLDLDPIHSIIEPLYSSTGRPACFQIQCLRAMILAVALKIPFPQLPYQLKLNRQLWIIAGFDSPTPVPSVASFYNFMHRYCPMKENKATVTQPARLKTKPAKGKKLAPQRKKAVQTLLLRFQRYPHRRFFNTGPEKILQRLFEILAIQRSKAVGLLTDQWIVSGDGTCIPSHATPWVRKKCDCANKSVCPHVGRITDPNARWGYDSSKESYFYGYTGYFLATYHSELKKDLPLSFRLVEAQRHDSVSAVVALHELNYLSPTTQISHFIADAAHDNYAFYEWLDSNQIHPIIPLNLKNTGNRQSDKAPITIAADGTPWCLGEPMRYNGYMKDRCRHKWRCAICSSKRRRRENPDHNCSDSPYGRVFYTKSDDDLRLYPIIARQSKAWRSLYKQRTAIERLNKTLMVDDGLEHSRLRSKSHIYWHIFASFVLIHLKAQRTYKG